jgi:hypothetical protein
MTSRRPDAPLPSVSPRCIPAPDKFSGRPDGPAADVRSACHTKLTAPKPFSYSPTPSGRGRSEGRRAARKALAGAILPYAEVKTAIGGGTPSSYGSLYSSPGRSVNSFCDLSTGGDRPREEMLASLHRDDGLRRCVRHILPCGRSRRPARRWSSAVAGAANNVGRILDSPMAS